MSIPRSPECVLALLLLTALPAPCADAESAQRARIATERAAIERETRAAQAACAAQFAVTACVDRIKAERRLRLQSLDQQRAVLADDMRKRRAAERIEQIRQRQAALADEQPKVTVRARSAAASEPATSRAAPARSPEANLADRQAAASAADARATLRASAAATRASEAAAHRSAIEARNRQRATLRAPAKPLPVPSAASQVR